MLSHPPTMHAPSPPHLSLTTHGPFTPHHTQLWDIDTKCILSIFDHHKPTLDFSPDGHLIVYSSWDTVHVWNLETGQLVECLMGHTEGVSSVVFTPNGEGLVSGDENGSLKYWDLEPLLSSMQRGALMQSSEVGLQEAGSASGKSVQNEGAAVHSVAVSHDNQWVELGSPDQSVRFWDLHTGEEQLILHGHKSGVLSVDLSPTGDMLATSAQDGTIHTEDALQESFQQNEGVGAEDEHVFINKDGSLKAMPSDPAASCPDKPDTGNRKVNEGFGCKQMHNEELWVASCGRSQGPRAFSQLQDGGLGQVSGAIGRAVGEHAECKGDTIDIVVPPSKPVRWLSREPTDLKKAKNRLNHLSYVHRAVADHPSHEEHREITERYSKAKAQHWAEYLEDLNDRLLWMTGKVTNPNSACVRHQWCCLYGRDQYKSAACVAAFFPPKPPELQVPLNYKYPKRVNHGFQIHEVQLRQQLNKLKPTQSAR
ncbi:WD40-repeat-containing domain protein [Gautieria morchelliformis]|nr:WD40-repeat-containing domain protein [Gautieria morchelliformis]